MKNFVKWFWTVTLVVIVGFSLIGCVIDSDGGSTHTHTWGDWRSNSTQHWRVCTDCGEESTRASHTGTLNCTVCGYHTGSTVTYSLDGIWQAQRGVSDHIVTISGSTGVFVQIYSHPLWQDAINKGYVKAGDQKFRNITKTGDWTWTAQGFNVIYNTPAPNVAIDARWSDNFTITMNANGLSFSDGSTTWYRR